MQSHVFLAVRSCYGLSRLCSAHDTWYRCADLLRPKLLADQRQTEPSLCRHRPDVGAALRSRHLGDDDVGDGTGAGRRIVRLRGIHRSHRCFGRLHAGAGGVLRVMGSFASGLATPPRHAQDEAA